jgi:hypothetical protein
MLGAIMNYNYLNFTNFQTERSEQAVITPASHQGDIRFKSQLRDRQFLYILWSVSVRDKCRDNALNFATTASLHVLFNILFINYPIVRFCKV